jgi:hypothetical protein
MSQSESRRLAAQIVLATPAPTPEPTLDTPLLVRDIVTEVLDSASQGYPVPIFTENDTDYTVIEPIELRRMVTNRIQDLMALITSFMTCFQRVDIMLSIYYLLNRYIAEIYFFEPDLLYGFVVAIYHKSQEFCDILKRDTTLVTTVDQRNLITKFILYAVNAEAIVKDILIKKNYFESPAILETYEPAPC